MQQREEGSWARRMRMDGWERAWCVRARELYFKSLNATQLRQTQQRTIRSPSSSSHCDHVPNDRVGPPYITSLTEQGVPHICLSPFLPSSLGLKRRLSQFALRRQALASTLAEDAPQPRAQTLGAAVPRNGVCVRVGVVVHPDGVVDGRWDLDQEMRHCQLPYKCMR